MSGPKTEEELEYERMFGGACEPLDDPEEEQPDKSGERNGANNSNKDGTTSSSQENIESVREDPTELYPVRGAKRSTSYDCIKCRHRLFTEAQQVTHSKLSKMHPKFKGAEVEGACVSALFLPLTVAKLLTTDESEDDDVDQEYTSVDQIKTQTMSLSRKPQARKMKDALLACLDDGSVLCGGCSVKVGSVGQDVACNCGRTMPGSTIRISGSKVERNEELSLAELQAKAEAERLEEEEREKTKYLIREGESKDRKFAAPKVNQRRHGEEKSTFGSYRGKDAKAQRVIKRKYNPHGRKEKGGGGGDSDEEDEFASCTANFKMAAKVSNPSGKKGEKQEPPAQKVPPEDHDDFGMKNSKRNKKGKKGKKRYDSDDE